MMLGGAAAKVGLAALVLVTLVAVVVRAPSAQEDILDCPDLDSQADLL